MIRLTSRPTTSATPEAEPRRLLTGPWTDLATAREHLLAAGCTHHRSPLRVDEQRQIRQLTDPFRTIIGLDGP